MALNNKQIVNQIGCDNVLFCYRQVLDALNRSTKRNSTEREALFRVFWEEYEASTFDNEISTAILTFLLTIYIILILFGALGSGLVIFVILRKQSMRNRGNLFILNLAISDLTLCLFTQPFNLLRLLTGYRNWMLGQFMCKFSATFQGTNVFVSTISITAIALDRFQCIIYPTPSRHDNRQTIIILCLAWIGSFILASPLAYFSRTLELTKIQCVEIAEDSRTQLLKVIYSVGALILQYLAPLLIVSIAYSRICLRIHGRYRQMMQRLHSRPFEIVLPKPVDNPDENVASKHEYLNPTVVLNSVKCKMCGRETTKRFDFNLHPPSDKQRLVNRRHRKAILLLSSIAIIFSLSWLPLNLMNVIIDFRSLSILKSLAVINLPKNVSDRFVPSLGSDSNHFEIQSLQRKLGYSDQFRRTPINELEPQTVTLLQFICLLLILSSACLNPILYGWLNANFRLEFRDVWWKQRHSLLYCSKCCSNTNRPFETSPQPRDHLCPSCLGYNYDRTFKDASHLLEESMSNMMKLSEEFRICKPRFTNNGHCVTQPDDSSQRVSSVPNLSHVSDDKLSPNPNPMRSRSTQTELNLSHHTDVRHVPPLSQIMTLDIGGCDSISEFDYPVTPDYSLPSPTKNSHHSNQHQQHQWTVSITSI